MPASFADWRDSLMPSLPGAVEPAVREVFLQTARAFYRDTRAWMLPLGPFAVWKGSQPLQLNPVDQSADVVRVESWLRGTEQTLDENALHLARVRGRSDGGLVMRDPHTAVVSSTRAPEEPEYASFLVSAIPSTEDALPDFASTHHHDALTAGTLHRLHMQVAKPYSNADQAAYQGRLFSYFKQIARADKDRLYRNAPTWLYPTVSPT